MTSNMIFKAWTWYQHINKGLMCCIADREVTPEIYRQYVEVVKEIVEPVPQDTSYDVKKQIERVTGITENEPVFTGLHRNEGRQWSKNLHRYLTASEIANGKRGG